MLACTILENYFTIADITLKKMVSADSSRVIDQMLSRLATIKRARGNKLVIFMMFRSTISKHWRM